MRFVACVVVGALATACPDPPRGPRYVGAGGTSPRRGGTFTFHHEDDVRTLDPMIGFDELSNAGIRLVFDTLLKYDDHGRLAPHLLREMPASTDGKLWRLCLREGVRFHHGREVVAEDVRWSLETMMKPNGGSAAALLFDRLVGFAEYRAGRAPHIAGIRVVSRYELDLELTVPDQAFLSLLGIESSAPVPREIYERDPPRFGRHPVGTGPYRFESWEDGVRLTFRRNPTYFIEGQPYVDRMIYELNLDRGAATLRFRNGDIDHLHRQTPADYLFFKGARAWQPYMAERTNNDAWGLLMNCGMPPFDNVHLRRAVAYAVDRDRWDAARAGRLYVSGQLLPPDFLGELPESEGQRYDLARAREEMRLAGFPNGLPSPVTLYAGIGAVGRTYAELAQNDLARIGIRIEIRQVAFPTFLDHTGRPRTVQMLFHGWQGDYRDPSTFFDSVLHSRSITPTDSSNRAFYSNPAMDSLLDRARRETDLETRRGLYQEAGRLAIRDAPWAFMFHNTLLFNWQPYVRNYRPHPVFVFEFSGIWIDGPRRRVASHMPALGGGGSHLAFIGGARSFE